MIPLFFFNDPPTTEIYTLSLHDALPISPWRRRDHCHRPQMRQTNGYNLIFWRSAVLDRKSTRLNSSHQITSYAVFCLKKKTVPAAMEGTLLGVPSIAVSLFEGAALQHAA